MTRVGWATVMGLRIEDHDTPEAAHKAADRIRAGGNNAVCVYELSQYHPTEEQP